jgi:hypothetical protein
MSSTTWTPGALSSEARALSGLGWRLVEAQHRVSTLKIVDSLDEQELLEKLIEDSKPPVPPECRHLHYLLSTPFRYGAVYPRGSRFRRAGLTEGVFYASEVQETAVAELAFYRLLFFAESPETPWPINPAEYTAFAAEYATGRAIDLMRRPFHAGASSWADPTEYGDCQRLADAAREAAVDVIRYRSVRDPRKGINLALLGCRAFARPEPTAFQTWRVYIRDVGVQAICEAPRLRIAFDRDSFAADPRIAKLKWQRR